MIGKRSNIVRRIALAAGSVYAAVSAEVAFAQAPGESLSQLNIAESISNLYNWALGVGAVIAFGIIVYGGVLYTASAGNPSRIDDAKKWIWAALGGLILLFTAFLILNVINPNLVNLENPFALLTRNPEVGGTEPEAVQITRVASAGSPQRLCDTIGECAAVCTAYCGGYNRDVSCDVPDEISRSLGIPAESETVFVDNAGITNVTGGGGVRILPSLIFPLQRAGEIALREGYQLNVESGFRSLNRQLEIACRDLSPSRIPRRVAWPGGSNHGSGVAVDIELRSLEGARLSRTQSYCWSLASIMYRAGWQRYVREFWHFEYPLFPLGPLRSTSVFDCAEP